MMARPHTYTTHPGDWRPEEDSRLLHALLGGLSFSKAAPIVGRNRDACLGRWRRLRRR